MCCVTCGIRESDWSSVSGHNSINISHAKGWCSTAALVAVSALQRRRRGHFAFDGDGVRFSSRLVTDQLREERACGRRLYSGAFGSKSRLRALKNPANTHVLIGLAKVAPVASYLTQSHSGYPVGGCSCYR